MDKWKLKKSEEDPSLCRQDSACRAHELAIYSSTSFKLEWMLISAAMT